MATSRSPSWIWPASAAGLCNVGGPRIREGASSEHSERAGEEEGRK